jgi:hypothetical protein
MTSRTTIYESIGGSDAVAAAVEQFYERVLGDLVATLTSLGVPGPTIATIGDALAPLKADIAPPENALAS